MNLHTSFLLLRRLLLLIEPWPSTASFEIWFKPEDLNDNHTLFEVGGQGSGSTLAMQGDQLHWITQTGNNSNR